MAGPPPTTSSAARAAARKVMERADRLARCSEEPGRITRSYGTPALREARDLVEGWMREAGLEVRRDAIGNASGAVPACSSGARTLLLGSHIDSVRDAGRYDGPLGVLVAIAAVELLLAEGHSAPFGIEVVAFADEEGLRYRSSYLASRALAGTIEVAELDFVDAAGISLRDAIRAMGGDPDALSSARRSGAELLGYVEVHIEQGPVLEQQGLALGVVSAIAGQSRGSVTFTGVAGHAGTVPAELRRDALCGAAEWVLSVEAEPKRHPGLVATVGQLAIEPSVGNVIPAMARASYDVRHSDDAEKARACQRLRDGAQQIGDRRGLSVLWETLQEHRAVPMAAHLVDALGRSVAAVGHPVHSMPSGAGHDAVPLHELTDVAMLFVRCRGGVSHHPDESVEEADVVAAIAAIAELLRSPGLEARR